jgi:uncharacterized protein YfkK (UPF0435 family)
MDVVYNVASGVVNAVEKFIVVNRHVEIHNKLRVCKYGVMSDGATYDVEEMHDNDIITFHIYDAHKRCIMLTCDKLDGCILLTDLNFNIVPHDITGVNGKPLLLAFSIKVAEKIAKKVNSLYYVKVVDDGFLKNGFELNYTKHGGKTSFAHICLFTMGYTWYESVGFIPFDEELGSRSEENIRDLTYFKNFVTNVKVKDTMTLAYTEGSTKLLYPNASTEELTEIVNFVKHHENSNLVTFFCQFVKHIDKKYVITTCVYKLLIMDNDIKNVHGMTYYIPLKDMK